MRHATSDVSNDQSQESHSVECHLIEFSPDRCGGAAAAAVKVVEVHAYQLAPLNNQFD